MVLSLIIIESRASWLMSQLKYAHAFREINFFKKHERDARASWATAIGIDAGELIQTNNKVEDKTSIHCRWHEKNYEIDEKGNPSMIESDKPASDTVDLH